MKNSKIPPQSMTGQSMEALVEKLKRHKVQQGLNKSISEMNASLQGQGGILKKAYLMGVKYAEESVSKDPSSDNPAGDNPDKTEEEKVIEIIRRGWPDPVKSMKNDPDVPGGREDKAPLDDGYDREQAKKKAKMTAHSPETTI